MEASNAICTLVPFRQELIAALFCAFIPSERAQKVKIEKYNFSYFTYLDN